MRISSAVFLIIILTLLGCQKVLKYEPTFKVSETTTHKISEDQEFTFGYLEVPENRKSPSSNLIKLPVYIFKSRSPNPKPDPILYTVGGPGYSSMSASQYMEYYQYLDDRDFILFEQRGTEYAQPNLSCPEWSKAVYRSNLPNFDKNQSDSLFNAAARSCSERLVSKGIDLNGYNTNEIAADIEDLRKVFKIDKINLLTISYSTKIAQVLMRDYSESLRSVVMDSALPLEVNYDEESVGNIMEVIDKLLSDCEADINCNDEFPNLKERFYAFLRDKTNEPLVVEVQNPISGNMEVFYLKGQDLIFVFTSASTDDVPDIPLEISKLLNNDFSSVKKKLMYLFEEPNNGYGRGMRLSVWCAEEYPFISQSKVKEETFRYPEVRGLSPAIFKSEVCEIWGVKKANKFENQPIKSDIPVLLISGEYDELTPVKWASRMGGNLNSSFHFIFNGWKHTLTTNWGNPCAMKVANDFFNNPLIEPNPKCLMNIGKTKFAIE